MSPSRDEKLQFLTFGGLLHPVPLLVRAKFGMLQLWSTLLHSTLTCQILSCCPLVAKNLKFCHFGLWHFMVSTVGGNLRKLNISAQLQTFPYSRVSKLFLYSNALMIKSCTQTLTFLSVTYKQTDKKLNVFGCPGGKWDPSPTKLGTVIEDLEHILAPWKLLGVQCTILLPGSAEIQGKPIALKLKPPQLCNPLNKSIQIITANTCWWNNIQTAKFHENRAGIHPCGAFIFQNLIKFQ